MPSTQNRSYVISAYMKSVVAAMTSLTLLIAACGSSTENDSDGVEILVTSSILGDVVNRIAGDTADVTVLMEPGVNPHDFQLSAKQASQMRTTDLLIVSGGGLEDGLQGPIAAAESDGAKLLEVFPLLDTASDNPHFFTDPELMVLSVTNISDAIAEIEGMDQQDRDQIQENADSYAGELETLIEKIESQVSEVPDDSRDLITDHNEFSYFAERFGFEIAETLIEGSTHTHAADAGHIAEVTEVIEANDISAIFVTESGSQELAETIVLESPGIEVVELYSEALGPEGSGADTYVGMMQTNVDRIVEALSK